MLPNRAILWFISSKKVYINKRFRCHKWFSFRNTGECSQMFDDETVNSVGDIFLHKYVLLHVSYYPHNRKQSDKIKVEAS